MSELYTSLCVLENQQFVPVSVLARMWSRTEASAEDFCMSLSSMSLAKVSTQMLDERKQHAVNIDFGRENASRSREEQSWHRRLLVGHLANDTISSEAFSSDAADDLRGINILEYTPRECWKSDIPNSEYIRRNMSRHLRRAGFELELEATVSCWTFVG